MAERAHRLHDILNLRPDQDAALNNLIAALGASKHDDGMRHDGDDMAKLTTPERLDRLNARMAEHQAAFQARATAIKQFYAALSPEQQRAFDALPGLMGGGDHMGHGGFDHRGPHGMGQGGPQ
jgi:Spy/CpxP family protein refolding chaperone